VGLGYVVIADELEGAVKDLILHERTSDAYADEIRRLLLEKEEFRKGAAEAADAEPFAQSRQLAWERISAASNETRDLAATWEQVGLEERGCCSTGGCSASSSSSSRSPG